MPDKPLTIATYAAGASLAAITLVYVFGPTFFLDDEAAQSSRSSRKKGVVGLHNPANDCFINSVLQTLAGLPELRLYLIRELHRRKLDGKEIYSLVGEADGDIAPNNGKDIVRKNETKEPEWKVRALQEGLVTAGLKVILDQLNERPIYKKTISAGRFVQVLEQAFRTRISRQQQDAQEFMQVVTERLSDEYYAGRKARRKARDSTNQGALRDSSSTPHATLEIDGELGTSSTDDLERSEDTIKPKKTNINLPEESGIEQLQSTAQKLPDAQENDPQYDQGFPFEGKIESQIECLHCHFKPKPSVSSFVTLTLNVPHATYTSLNACFDGMLKVEHIDDFKCDRCRLQHALEVKKQELATPSNSERRTSLEKDIKAIQHALDTDPETPPKDVTLPELSQAPKRRITRHMRISSFPRILAIHLSRSMWAPQSTSTKNLAKVEFPETFPLGGILDQKSYRLLGVVTHKGGHNSGHYESFRRQVLPEPFSTPASMGTEGVYSAKGSPKPSSMPSPKLGAGPDSKDAATSPQLDSPVLDSASSSASTSSRSSLSPRKTSPKASETDGAGADRAAATATAATRSNSLRPKSLDLAKFKRKPKKLHNRWWRISDDKIKESKTSDVLGMQREVYLLFYEMNVPETDGMDR